MEAGEEGDGSGGWKEKTDVFIDAGGGRRDDDKFVTSSNQHSFQRVHHYMFCSQTLS